MTRFPTDDSCMEYLVSMRWPKGTYCPRCGATKVHKLARPWNWQCKGCSKTGYRFSPLVGTIFENTNVGLRTWFQVIYLMCQSKKGMSALQIHRIIGSGSYRTAWYMCHRIRAAIENDEFKKLTGVVEVDETYIGGKARNRHGGGIGGGRRKGHGGRGPAGKLAVIGAISRKGKVVARMIENTDADTLQGFVKGTVGKVSMTATDQASGYFGLPDKFHHQSVNHAAKEYVRGIVHTGSIDSFWSLIKRGIMGSYHHVSKDYLPLYLNEYAFRHNNRKDPDVFAKVVAQA